MTSYQAICGVFPFLETIHVRHGVPALIQLHQDRIQRVFDAHFEGQVPHDLNKLLSDAPVSSTSMKCRVRYNATDAIVSYAPYAKRNVDALWVREVSLSYDEKYAFRLSLNMLKAGLPSSAEALIVTSGLVREGTYANVVCQLDGKWVTPKNPIFHGVMRTYLLQQETIHLAQLSLDDMRNSSAIRLINAMMPWEDCIELSPDQLKLT